MTETQLIVTLLNALVVVVAAGLFVRFLCDEYVRMLELYGLIRPVAKAPVHKPKR